MWRATETPEDLRGQWRENIDLKNMTDVLDIVYNFFWKQTQPVPVNRYPPLYMMTETDPVA
jgi:hypothetical protein